MGRPDHARPLGLKRGLVAGALAGGTFISIAATRYAGAASTGDLALVGAVGVVGLVLLGIAVHGLFDGMHRRLARARSNGVASRA